MGSIMNGGGGATLISGSGTLINAKNVGKSMTCTHIQINTQEPSLRVRLFMLIHTLFTPTREYRNSKA
jgi:hypothetical protein